MNKTIIVDLFAEDKAHEEFMRAAIKRLSAEIGVSVTIQIRSARGGHGKAVSEFAIYQAFMEKGFSITDIPDIIVVAIDCNCKSYNSIEKDISAAVHDRFKERTVFSLPDPHIERWYLADVNAVRRVVGIPAQLPRKKCKRDLYKKLLADTIIKAGHPPALGGIEFAEEIVNAMDFYAAGKSESSFNLFVKNMTASLKRTVGDRADRGKSRS